LIPASTVRAERQCMGITILSYIASSERGVQSWVPAGFDHARAVKGKRLGLGRDTSVIYRAGSDPGLELSTCHAQQKNVNQPGQGPGMCPGLRIYPTASGPGGGDEAAGPWGIVRKGVGDDDGTGSWSRRVSMVSGSGGSLTGRLASLAGGPQWASGVSTCALCVPHRLKHLQAHRSL
jgi:hypothetical protein